MFKKMSALKSQLLTLGTIKCNSRKEMASYQLSDSAVNNSYVLIVMTTLNMYGPNQIGSIIILGGKEEYSLVIRKLNLFTDECLKQMHRTEDVY